MVNSKVSVTDNEGKILALFVYDGTINTGRDERKSAALDEAVKFVGYDIATTGRKNNGTIYRSDMHEIGFLSSGSQAVVGDYL